VKAKANETTLYWPTLNVQQQQNIFLWGLNFGRFMCRNEWRVRNFVNTDISSISVTGGLSGPQLKEIIHP
jgi:hypothetical protein